jgi:hypothetical protein
VLAKELPPIDAAADRVLRTAGEFIDDHAGAAAVIAPVAADPAPSDQEIAMHRMAELMGRVSDSAIADLRQLRDDVDSTIRAIQARHTELSNSFQHHIECVEASVAFRAIASEHLANVRSRFSLPPQRVVGGG